MVVYIEWDSGRVPLLRQMDASLFPNALQVFLPPPVSAFDRKDTGCYNTVPDTLLQLPCILNDSGNILCDWARPVEDARHAPICVARLQLDITFLPAIVERKIATRT